MASAISVDAVSKRYRVGDQAPHRSLIDTLAGGRRTGGDKDDGTSVFWALKDVSFEVEAGACLGIVGQNGSGKSTLLKILSRITEPTSGVAVCRGRVSSLLEVGTGFHPQLSGRDNIFLSGAVLGMRRSEIVRKLDQIIDFSGVEQFIDEPVKHYSSGMFLRLAFAVAANLETEILLVDEVLAVGDLAFQRKCLDRMDDVVQQGRTILFVSHNLTAVRTLCKEAIMLKSGQITAAGSVDEVLASYYLDQWTPSSSAAVDPDGQRSTPSAPVRVHDVEARPANGERGAPIDTSASFMIDWTFEIGDGATVDQVGVQIHDEDGLLILDQSPWELVDPIRSGRYRTRCCIPGRLLNDGAYFVSLIFLHRGDTLLELPNALRIDLLDGGEGRHGWYGKWRGVIRPKLDWRTEQLSPGD